MQERLGLVLLTACALAGGAVAQEPTVIYAADSVSSGTLADGALTVTGRWDLSGCGQLKVDFDAADAPASDDVLCTVTLANPNAVFPTKRHWHSEGIFEATVCLKKGQTSFVLDIPPAMPELQAVVRRLDAVDVTGLFDLVWPHPMWSYKGAGWGNNFHCWTLDARDVVSCTVKCPWKGGAKPVRIAASGAPHAVASCPAFAKRQPEEFFPFIDRYGQFKWRDWPGKVRDDAELKASIAAEDADLAAHPAPADHDKWGGWKDGPRFAAAGSFYVKKVDGKWWFVDPDGCLWWSHGPVRVSPSCGMTCVKGREHYFDELPSADSPFAAFYKTRDELLWPYYVKYGVTNTYDFSAANLCRKYGKDWLAAWADRAHRRLKSWGANTIANSSDARVMRLSRTPYCDRFELKSRPIAGTEKLGGWWPFRDPFDPSFVAYVREQMLAHKAEMDDPWCFGFFVDNELTWGKPGDLARWTWASPDDQPAKVEFRKRLAAKYGAVPAMPSDADFESFSYEIAEAYFRNVRDTFKACAPQKLYMGCRFSGAHPFVVRLAAKYVDVMSFNYYERDVGGFNRMPSDIDKPVIIGEFHFGALDRGPIRPGLIQLKDQAERGETYRRYLTSALRDPRFVGVHWHQYADDVATGRFDGENFQIGWVDICDNPYPETIEAVRWVGANMYRLRAAAVSQASARPEISWSVMHPTAIDTVTVGKKGRDYPALLAIALVGSQNCRKPEAFRPVFTAALADEALVTYVGAVGSNALRVAFTLCPSPVSFVRCEMRLPDPSVWDGRLWGRGNGGWAGHVRCHEIGSSATVHTDLGTSRIPIGTNPVDPEILKDFGWRATHLMTVAAKKIIRAYYGRDAHHAYFYGESTGGGQGLCEVQRYPEDYDGVIAGVPAFDRSTRATTIWQNNDLHRRFGGKWFSGAEKAAIRKAELAVFARTDPPEARGKFIWNPHPTPEKLDACWKEIVAACPALADRRDLWYALFDPVVVNGRRLAPGQLLGVEFAFPWTFMLEKRTGPREGGKTMTAEELIAFSEDADLVFKSPDLAAFRARGGKLIMYSGLEDEAVPPRPIAEYYAAVAAKDGPAVKTGDYFAFYEIPGRWHNHLGKPDGSLGSVGQPKDLNEKIVAWVERGEHPGTLEVPFVREKDKSIRVEPVLPVCGGQEGDVHL